MCFSEYRIETDTESGVEMAVVPDRELGAMIEELHLARAASPASCNHPADGLQPFELVPDCCVCTTCGAVIKWYGVKLAKALGLGEREGWYRLTAELLSMEVYLAFLPMVEAVDYFTSEMGQYGAGKYVRHWADSVGSRNEALHKRGVYNG